MSENRIDLETFSAETSRLEALRGLTIFREIGGIGPSRTNMFEELPDHINSEPIDALSASEKADDDFDEKVASYFDSEQTYGYHFLSTEAGRLLLTSEEPTQKSGSERLPHTVLAAKIVDGNVELTQFRQPGEAIEVTLLPEDWHAVNQAVSELGKVSARIEQEEN